jgi:hypothetical protein
MLKLKTPAATATKIPERIGPWSTLVVILHGIKKVMIQEGREETKVRQDGEEHCGG